MDTMMHESATRLSQLVSVLQRELEVFKKEILQNHEPTPTPELTTIELPILDITQVNASSSQPVPFSLSPVMVPMEMSYDEAKYEITLDVPGITASGITISIEPGNVLKVHGQRPSKQTINMMTTNKNGDELTSRTQHVYSDRYFGAFSRSVKLPLDIDTQNVDASVHNGILTIRIARKTSADKLSGDKN